MNRNNRPCQSLHFWVAATRQEKPRKKSVHTAELFQLRLANNIPASFTDQQLEMLQKELIAFAKIHEKDRKRNPSAVCAARPESDRNRLIRELILVILDQTEVPEALGLCSVFYTPD